MLPTRHIQAFCGAKPWRKAEFISAAQVRDNGVSGASADALGRRWEHLQKLVELYKYSEMLNCTPGRKLGGAFCFLLRESSFLLLRRDGGCLRRPHFFIAKEMGERTQSGGGGFRFPRPLTTPTPDRPKKGDCDPPFWKIPRGVDGTAKQTAKHIGRRVG